MAFVVRNLHTTLFMYPQAIMAKWLRLINKWCFCPSLCVFSVGVLASVLAARAGTKESPLRNDRKSN